LVPYTAATTTSKARAWLGVTDELLKNDGGEYKGSSASLV
jgi:hypothetical protein